jgi:uncharacterized damage-inducible protein DinB
MASAPELWLNGPVEGVPALLQPVAHALVQARADVQALAPAVPAALLWARRGAASPGFHLIHMAGALDRLFTYARGEALTAAQKDALRAESLEHPSLDAAALAARLGEAIDRALDELRRTDPSTLTDERRVGRAGLPTTVGGALFHAAEHTARHAGQFVTTVKLLAAQPAGSQGQGGGI